MIPAKQYFDFYGNNLQTIYDYCTFFILRSETYRGKFAFSEPETRAIKDFILNTMKSQEIKVG